MPDGLESQLLASIADSQLPAEEHYVDAFFRVEQNEFLSNGDLNNVYDGVKQFNASYQKSTQRRNEEDSDNGTMHIAELHEVSGFTYLVDACPPSQKASCDTPKPHIADDLSPNKDCHGEMEENHFKETSSTVPVVGNTTKVSGNDYKEEKQFKGKSSTSGGELESDSHISHDSCDNLKPSDDRSYPEKVFLTISDISLRTKPSRGPPPSRPPPKLAIKQGDSNRIMDGNLRSHPVEEHFWKPSTVHGTCSFRSASESSALEEAAKDSSSCFFDVEVDASSAAAASAAAMKEAMEKAQVRLKSAKLSMERKKFQNLLKPGLDNSRKGKETRETAAAQENHKYIEEKVGEWRAENQFFEFVKDDTLKGFQGVPQQEKNKKLNATGKVQEHVYEEKVTKETNGFSKNGKLTASKEATLVEENDRVSKGSKEAQEGKEKEKKLKEATAGVHRQEENDEKRLKAIPQEVHMLEVVEKLKAVVENFESESNKKKFEAALEACEQEENEKKLRADQEACERENGKKLMVAHERAENEKRLKAAREACEQEENKKRLKAAREAREQEQNERRLKAAREAREQEENERRLKAAQEAHEQEENEKRLKDAEEAREREENKKRLRAAQEAREREENERRLKADQEAREWEENEKRLKAAQEARELEENEKKLKVALKAREWEENERRLRAAKEACEREENEKRLRAAQEAREQEENERRLRAAQEAREQEENKRRLKAAEEAREREENEKRIKAAEEAREREENEKRLRAAQEAREWEENEKRLRAAQEAREREENEKRLRAAQEARKWEENEKRLRATQEAHEQEENDKMLKAAQEASELEENERKLKASQGACHNEEGERRLKAAAQVAREWEENERCKKAMEEEGHDREENEKRSKVAQEACENEKIDKRLKTAPEAQEHEKNEIRLEASQMAQKLEKDEERLKAAQAPEWEENQVRSMAAEESYDQDEFFKRQKAAEEAHEHEESERKLKEACELSENKLKATPESYEWKENGKKLKETQEAYEYEENLENVISCSDCPEWEEMGMLKIAHEGHELEQNEKLKAALADQQEENKGEVGDRESGLEKELKATPEGCHQKGKEKSLKAVQEAHEREEARMKAAQEAQHCEEEMRWKAVKADENHMEKKISGKASEQVIHDQEEEIKQLKTIKDNSRNEQHAKEVKAAEVVCSEGGEMKLKACNMLSEQDEKMKSKAQVNDGEHTKELKSAHEPYDGTKLEAAQQADVLEEKEDMPRTVSVRIENKITARKQQSATDSHESEVKAKEERRRREAEMERARRLEEEMDREREREKDRILVERATREARDRAFLEVRERAERAAVERATAEARQRAFVEAREKAEKASAEAREKQLAEKAAVEARLRAERAAVERATTEARERAIEKALAEKAALGAKREDRYSGHESSSGTSQRYSNSSNQVGFLVSWFLNDIFFLMLKLPTPMESIKVLRLNRQKDVKQGLREINGLQNVRYVLYLQPAKALAEKSLRDILAQREQAERNCLEDQTVRGYLAFVSEYIDLMILVPDSGWQPIPLTDVITAAAVKKAYRKATLCVHPDKVQQRGASIQQKYICEKVFDLLKLQLRTRYFPAMNRSKSHHGYLRLGRDYTHDHVLLHPSDPKSASIPNQEEMTSVGPSQTAGAPKNFTLEKMDPKLKRSTKVAKNHPLLSFFEVSRKKKAPSAKPEFIRYLEYVKEGGTWDLHSNRPVIHFK
ncbi:hypothetical protein ACLOJK_001817 [Asimina triloba]